MNIEAHKKAKPRQTGKDVKPFYDMKRERERAAVEEVRLRNKRDATANAARCRAAATLAHRRGITAAYAVAAAWRSQRSTRSCTARSTSCCETPALLRTLNE